MIRKADHSTNIKSADGTPIKGGTHGCLCSIFLPLRSYTGETKLVQCAPFGGFEADVGHCGIDVVLGFPFLKAFSLYVDCRGSNIGHVPSA